MNEFQPKIITPFGFYCQHVLPLVYDQSLSYYEVLCKLQAKLNEVIKTQNDLQEAFQNLLNWVNAQLETYTKEQLQGWMDDGTFDKLVNVTKLNKLQLLLETKINDIYVSVNNYPVLDGETDDTNRLQRALNDTINKILVIPYGTTLNILNVNLNSNQTILLDGSIIVGNNTSYSLICNDIENITLIGKNGSIKTTNNIDQCSAIRINNVTNFLIERISINGFKNKSIDITGTSKGKVINCNISYSNGSTGAGISLFSNTVKNCDIINNNIKNCRIGVALNGCQECYITNNTLLDNDLSGIMIDGIVTGSGDGGTYNYVNNNIVKGCTNTNYGAIYLGNGSSHNTIVNNYIKSNLCSGIRITTSKNIPCEDNFIASNTITLNKHGIEMSFSSKNYISDNLISSNTLRGVTANTCDNNVFKGNKISNNTNEGMMIQSGLCQIIANYLTENSIGLSIQFGGSTPVGNNVINNISENNTTEDYKLGGTFNAKNNINYPNKKYGNITLSGDGENTIFNIPHGLPKTPLYANVQPNSVNTPLDFFVTVNATDIVVTFKTPPSNVKNGIKFLWNCEF